MEFPDGGPESWSVGEVTRFWVAVWGSLAVVALVGLFFALW